MKISGENNDKKKKNLPILVLWVDIILVILGVLIVVFFACSLRLPGSRAAANGTYNSVENGGYIENRIGGCYVASAGTAENLDITDNDDASISGTVVGYTILKDINSKIRLCNVVNVPEPSGWFPCCQLFDFGGKIMPTDGV